MLELEQKDGIHSGARSSSILLGAAILCVLRGSALAADPPAPPEATASAPRTRRLELFAGVGYLASPGGGGTAISAGARFSPLRHLALSLDAGYGVLSAFPNTQDRWWVIPSVALVIPAGPVRVDLGVGAGVGTATGFASWSAYGSDRTVWANQLVPTVRAHAVASALLTKGFGLFARVDVASLWLDGNSLGLRSGSARPGIADSMWVNLSFGAQFGLL